jgi:hypothetical protein
MKRFSAALLSLSIAACTMEAPPVELGNVEEISVPAGPGSAQAHLAATFDDRVVLSWLEPEDDATAFKFAVFADGAWSPAATIARGDNFFVNWADYPSVEPVASGTWVAHWLVLQPEAFYHYDIAYSMSFDDGRSWSEPGRLNGDKSNAEHGFVSLFPWDDGFGAIWIDGRKLGSMTIDEIFESEEVIGLELYYARLNGQGEVLERGLLDGLVCDCCQTDAASTSNGPLVVYRDRSLEEQRDIVVRGVGPDGWEEAHAVADDRWFIDGCPVNGPAIDARGAAVAVAWFTAPDGTASVRFARSSDAGASFGPALELDGAGAFGHVDVELLDDSSAAVSWWRRGAEGGIDLVVRQIGSDGTPHDEVVVGHTETSGVADVPQMAQSGDELVLVWTDTADQFFLRSATVGLRTQE